MHKSRRLAEAIRRRAGGSTGWVYEALISPLCVGEASKSGVGTAP